VLISYYMMIRLGSNVLLHGGPPGQQKKISHDDGRRGSGDSDRGKGHGQDHGQHHKKH
ncbi:unnamed protein product, partial [Rotaria sordida]